MRKSTIISVLMYWRHDEHYLHVVSKPKYESKHYVINVTPKYVFVFVLDKCDVIDWLAYDLPEMQISYRTIVLDF